jgi:EAL domain-containing protein (putative c-di-GMP-specific phosphodiesterase class I)
VRSIVAIAEQFDVTTIAEGVEDEATLREVKRCGVDLVQGYLIGRPRPIGESRAEKAGPHGDDSEPFRRFRGRQLPDWVTDETDVIR